MTGSYCQATPVQVHIGFSGAQVCPPSEEMRTCICGLGQRWHVIAEPVVHRVDVRRGRVRRDVGLPGVLVRDLDLARPAGRGQRARVERPVADTGRADVVLGGGVGVAALAGSPRPPARRRAPLRRDRPPLRSRGLRRGGSDLAIANPPTTATTRTTTVSGTTDLRMAPPSRSVPLDGRTVCGSPDAGANRDVTVGQVATGSGWGACPRPRSPRGARRSSIRSPTHRHPRR